MATCILYASRTSVDMSSFVEAKYHLIKKIKETLVAQMHLNLESNLVRDTLFLDK